MSTDIRLEEAAAASAQGGSERAAWPDDVIAQLAAVRDAAAARAVTPGELAAAFRGARRDVVARHLETLAVLGELTLREDGRYQRVAEPVAAGGA